MRGGEIPGSWLDPVPLFSRSCLGRAYPVAAVDERPTAAKETDVSLAVGCWEFESWARVELRGRKWLPDGFGVRLPRSGRRELVAELPNFVTNDHSGLMVELLGTFENRAAPFGALARALSIADTPCIVPEQFSVRAVVRDVDEVVAFLRASLAHAEQWADATAAWQSRGR